jgi:hypothetical protein
MDDAQFMKCNAIMEAKHLRCYTYHQPEPALVNAPSAPSVVVVIEVTSPPASVGLPNVQSTPIRSDLVLSGGRVQLNTDLSASAMSGPISQNSQIPTNWWGYGMPPELSIFNSGLPQVFDVAGKSSCIIGCFTDESSTLICHIN